MPKRLPDREPPTEQFAAVPAEESPAPPGEEPVTEQFPAVTAEDAEAPAAPEPAASGPSGPSGPAASPAPQPPSSVQGHARVDARLLEAALLNLRKRVAAIPLVFQIAGSEEVKIERGKLLSQIDDYLLPRVRRSAAPVLVALVGSTGPASPRW